MRAPQTTGGADALSPAAVQAASPDASRARRETTEAEASWLWIGEGGPGSRSRRRSACGREGHIIDGRRQGCVWVRRRIAGERADWRQGAAGGGHESGKAFYRNTPTKNRASSRYVNTEYNYIL
ncbi:hypothetical protein ABZP36_005512 [Zizania latifolia]